MIVFVLSFLLSVIVFSQISTIDSLQNELDSYSKKDSIRVNLLISIAAHKNYTNPEDAFPYIEEAIDVSSAIKWNKGKVLALRQKGNLYYIMANNLAAIDAYHKALKISVSIGDKALESSLYGNLGNIHADLKEYDEALEKYELFLAISIKSDNRSNQIRALTNIAIIYNDINRSKEGIAYLDKALLLAKEEKNTFFIAAITNNLGLAYKKTKEYNKSLVYYKKAAAIAVEIQNKYVEASALNSIGRVNILLNKYKLAAESGKKALKIAQEMGAIEWQSDSWEVLSITYEHEGKAEEALMAYKKHIQFRDSVLNEEKRAALTRKEMQFKLEKQESEANSEIRRQELVKNTYLVGGILMFIASIIGYFLYKRRRDALEKKKTADFNTKVAETELKALRSQMNPHFIFNSLNSISDFMSKNDLETANEYLLKFAKLTRAILENSEKEWITLEEDLELMVLYIQIESLRLKKKLSYAIKVDDSIDVENTLLPPLILQPFIENSIWHGIAKKETNGHILIEIKKEDDIIVCIVDDDGVGRKKNYDVREEATSMGMKITKNRLDIINQIKKVKGSVEIYDKAQGVRVELKLPLELQF